MVLFARKLWRVGDRLADVDGRLKKLAQAWPGARELWWHEGVDDLLDNRRALMRERDLGRPLTESELREVWG